MAINELFGFVDNYRAWLHSVHLLKTETLTPPKRYKAHVYFGEPGWSMYESQAFHDCWDDALDDAVQVALDDLRRVFSYVAPEHDDPDRCTLQSQDFFSTRLKRVP